MNHKSRSHHASVLMSGHNPEHSHQGSSSHRGTSNVHHHMKNSEGNHSNSKPCDILMRQHHFHGGIASDAPHYAKGGKAHRRSRHANGGPIGPMGIIAGRAGFNGGMGTNHLGGIPISEQPEFKNRRASMIRALSQGPKGPQGPQGPFPNSYRAYKDGGSCYSEGGDVEHLWELLHAKGGRTRSHRKHHAEGGEAIDHLQNRLNQVKSQYYGKPYKNGGECYAEGGETKDYGEKPLTGQLRKGGRAMHRKHHYEGEAVEGDPVADNSVRQEQKKGGRSKRQHHYWGQNVIGRLPLIGGIANSIANTAGTLSPNKYGGSEYVAKTKGQKAADIFSTIGNLGANIALSKGGAKKRKGGSVNHHAAGGAAKVRKGMMTESGRMIHTD